MKRTITLVTAARAKGVELPVEWVSIVNIRPPISGGCIGITDPIFRECYIGPDLTLPENLHHAFRFADALFCQVDTYAENTKSDRLVPLSKAVCWRKDGKVFTRTAPERHLALIAACEAALGIQHGKEIA